MKRFAFLAIILVLIVGGIWWFLAYRDSFQSVTLITDSQQSLAVYKGGYEGDGHTASSLGAVVRTVVTSDSFKLKKGGYTIVLKDDRKQYASTVFNLLVADDPVTLEIHPDYSTAKLATLLPAEQSTILDELQTKYAQIGKSFNVVSGSLYGRGDWYGALLKPNDPAIDTYRVVLQKKDGNWVLAVSQPEIIISHIKYLNIPTSVVVDVDNFKR